LAPKNRPSTYVASHKRNGSHQKDELQSSWKSAQMRQLQNEGCFNCRIETVQSGQNAGALESSNSLSANGIYHLAEQMHRLRPKPD
jgi:hypothetical protein